jgi:hypothetical protein
MIPSSVLRIVVLLVGIATISVSSYSIRSNEDDTDSVKYKVSVGFLVVGLVITAVGIAYWTTVCKTAVIEPIKKISREDIITLLASNPIPAPGPAVA